MKTYTIYFHDFIETAQELDYDQKKKDYVPNGNETLMEDDYNRFLNPALKIRFLESWKDKFRDITQIFVECWLSFYAEDDKEAISKVNKILEKNGFEWVCVYYLLETTGINDYQRIVKAEGLVPEDQKRADEEIKLTNQLVDSILKAREAKLKSN